MALDRIHRRILTLAAAALGLASCSPSGQNDAMRTPYHYGYYVFLGRGDFPPEIPLTPEWTSTWDLPEWNRRIDRLADLGANTLFVYLLGFHLPYASRAFPGCVEEGHPNVKMDFFQGVLDHCRERRIEVVAVFTTTGHARSYVHAHPDLAIRTREGQPDLKQEILCHHREGGRAYPAENIRECLTRYRGFSGVILHPPEFLNPCFCGACQEEYLKETGRDLFKATDEEAKGFFMRSYMRFQKTALEPEIHSLAPKARQLTFTIPWVFAHHFEEVAKEIDPRTVIVDWDYELTPKAVADLPARLERHRKFGHELWFMPTSGYIFSGKKGAQEQADVVLSQIRAARGSGVKDIVYFMGPIWWPDVERTSWRLHGK